MILANRFALGALLTLSVLAAASPVSASDLTANQATIDAATLVATTPPHSGAPAGVSPEAFYDAATSTYYLLTTAPTPKQYSSADGVTWTETSTLLPAGIDWSIVQEGPTSFRLYYAEMVISPGSGPPKPCTPNTKRLRYATSTDLKTWTPQPGVLLDDLGCGVPHVMKTSAGNYFLYFNKVDGKHGIFTSTSADGLAWSAPRGPLNGDEDLVDPAPLELPDGTFLMVASTTGSKGGYQQLQLLASTDAVTWVKRSTALLASSEAAVFDPSVELVNGEVRLWFGFAPMGDHNNSRITNGVLTLGAQEPEPTPEITATCSKVKSAKVLTVSCTATSTGIDPGTPVTAHVRLRGKTQWESISKGVPKIDAKGTFTWRYRPGSTKSASVTIYFTAALTQSPPVTVKLR